VTQNKFEAIKRSLQLANNENLNAKDKVAVRPLHDMLNTNVKQFGIFKQNLSVDEQILSYFGNHSAKMLFEISQ